MASSVARARLIEERKAWRADHPVGFSASPNKRADGSTDLFTWTCRVPGRDGSAWAGPSYILTISFDESTYPSSAPLCR